ncbi:bifunctional DNA-formamidopyrimidine glycosylase/DNA-(apurinic or apyrimidinic site) lyase [Neobacillus sp. DY30]|uniref:bifunctional DNA-formamidopyrimidine glycosylase/DNA-(apurinic or apyrimidinic site) lyase n=1 Tax=Neobacillus sp. DY30 TaxID=3047871 RepID=UPI0024BF9521|nr:bifunctional DNA-formamidopyrimidine glycosylase/DNA-(apurinic or apyrimidinic site) lyase [Neobacillus sp. DY30]WHX98678.1 bifunctional DNA-formamidopyrimidine glycosylase/DNA-(apurinic or apyrimidinic site) lyase [Neobacillus sp. DY30]
MPELPEMENYRRLLNQKIAGQTITQVQINREKSVNVNPTIFINTITNHKILTVNRRGKHLLFHLDNGQVMLLHLMLGGWMYFGTEEDKPNRTIQVRISFRNHHLYFIGLRLGYLHLYREQDVQKELSSLGPEPLDPSFTAHAFLKLLGDRRGKIKTKLLDQEFIAGIGNCYSDEICYHARIKTKRSIEDIEEIERNQLYESMKHVLLDALKHGGYMENPLFQGDNLTGGYNNLCLVYDREGETCKRCGGTIVKEMISSRKTFFCPVCQK